MGVNCSCLFGVRSLGGNQDCNKQQNGLRLILFLNLMKKKLSILSLLLVFTMTAMAQTPVNGIYYNLNDSENTAEVVSNNSDHYIYSGNIIIPSSISVNGVDYSVTSIGFQAFTGCSGLTSIKIPNSVTLIGKYAFYYCI